MKLNDYFKAFIGNISLNPQRIERIERAFNTWEQIFKNDEELSDMLVDFYKQGSYATGTAVKPQNGNEFDVDSVIVLDFDNDVTPKEAIDKLAERMKSNEAYKDKISKHNRCIRVNYAGDFHLDVVPAKPTLAQYILIPNRKEDDWEKTNPRGYAAWANAKGSGFKKVVMMVKYWRDRSVGKDTAPKSILLTTIIGDHYTASSSDAEKLVFTLENLVKNIGNYLVNGEPYVGNPALPGENLARDWDRKKYDIFKGKLKKFAEDARDALDEEDKEKSIEKWNAIFGNAFPTQLPEAADTAAKVASGAVFINEKGNINTDSGVAVKGHRFYGVSGYGE
ncbi:MAG: cyclic GMP-AMP synthase DncV-like nucleotidyltransferase [Syntrophomonas sp.]